MIKNYSKAVITIHRVIHLEMDVRGWKWNTILNKIRHFQMVTPNLNFRKVPGQPLWMMRTGGRWINHTRIEII